MYPMLFHDILVLHNHAKTHTLIFFLKIQSFELYNNKYMIISTQISNTELCAVIAVLDFKLLSKQKRQ